MTAIGYQRATKSALSRYFADVRLEWSAVKDATDFLAADDNRYAPRVDIAVGPFNTRPDLIRRFVMRFCRLGGKLRLAGLSRNRNPRCLLAIEVIYSGNSKHIMGDM
jgi:hypothetical protein